MKNKLKHLFRRLSGISTPIGGLKWEPLPDEQKRAYYLFQRMLNRRLPLTDHMIHDLRDVIESLTIMRDDITATLSEVSPGCDCRPEFERIREALKSFQTFIESDRGDESQKLVLAQVNDNLRRAMFEGEVREMRRVVGANLLQVDRIYGFSSEEHIRRNYDTMELLGEHDAGSAKSADRE